MLVLLQLWEDFSLFSCLTRSTTSWSCVCHVCVALVCVWIWQTQSRAGSTVVVRVHSSSCGAQLGVVHSPFEWLDHRCHCICRDLVLFVGRLPCYGGVCVAMSSGGGDFTPDGAYDSVWNSVRPMSGKSFINYFQYQEVVGCVCMLNYWFSSNDDICPDNCYYSGADEGKIHLQLLSVPRRLVCCDVVWCENFSPDGAYVSAWDSVMPTKGNTLSITSSTKTLLGVLRCRVVVKVSLLMVRTIMHETA